MSAGGGGGAGDVDLNIAPIVDCFTVLIAYLLVSMSFISLGIFEAGVATTGPAADTPPPAEVAQKDPPLSFLVSIAGANAVELKLTGGKEAFNEVTTVPARPDGPDAEAIAAKITELKQKHPTLAEVNITADPVIRYKMIVRVIESVKKVIPKVFLASG